MSFHNILIIEPDPSTAAELKDILQGLEYSIAGVAHSGAESIRMIEQSKPSIVLMNIGLRGRQDGLQTGSLLREKHDLPVVYMVDRSGRDTIQRAGGTGPFGFVFRPFDEKQVFATIETALIRHELEKKLQESLQWFNTTLTSIGDGVVASDQDGIIRFVNPVAASLIGWKHGNAVGKSLQEVFILIDELSHKLVDFTDPRNEVPDGDLMNGFVGFLHSQNGGTPLVEAKVTPIQDAAGRVYGKVLVFRDISMQREATLEIKRQANRAEALLLAASELTGLRESERLLNTICAITNRTLKAAGTMVVLWDATKNIYRSMATSSTDRLFLTYQDRQFEIQQDGLQALLPYQNPVVLIPDVRERPDLPFNKFFEELKIKSLVIAGLFLGEDLQGALLSVFAEGQNVPPEDEIALLRGLADQAAGAIENARLFEKVRAGRERQRKLAKGLVNIQETERRHIARELHDHLGQNLTGLQFTLERVKNQVDGKQRSDLEEIQGSISSLIGQVREISLNLRPSMLDDLGLLPTLKWHFERYTKQTGIEVDFHSESFVTRFPAEIETAAYRIIQEALTNTARYAQVKEAFVGLTLEENTLTVEVRDRGRGFDTSSVSDRPTAGLGGMRERADLVGGYLTVDSQPNRGTQITAVLPITGKPLERRKIDRKSPAG